MSATPADDTLEELALAARRARWADAEGERADAELLALVRRAREAGHPYRKIARGVAKAWGVPLSGNVLDRLEDAMRKRLARRTRRPVDPSGATSASATRAARWPWKELPMTEQRIVRRTTTTTTEEYHDSPASLAAVTPPPTDGGADVDLATSDIGASLATGEADPCACDEAAAEAPPPRDPACPPCATSTETPKRSRLPR